MGTWPAVFVYISRMRRLMFALAALAAVGGSARAQDVSVTGPCAKPDTLIFRGNSRITDAMLRGDAGIAPHTAVNYRAVQRAIKSLYATGQFESIQVSCDTAGGRAALAFDVRERPILGDVKVVGVDRLSAGSVRDRVDILIGRPIDPSQVAKSVARIDSMYEAAGYTLARVTVDTAIVAGQANLTFKVEEGRRLAVSGVRVQGDKALSAKTIVKSMKTRPEGFLWWKKGEYDEDKFAGDVTERIPELYAKNGYIDMQVTRDTLVVDRDRGKALVELNVVEGPKYRVGDFEVVGNKRFSAEEIRRYYPFDARGKTITEAVKGVLHLGSSDEDIFDKTVWDDATKKLQGAYATEGYIYADIRPVIERRMVGKDSVPTVNLRWEITERMPAIVNRVEILGNDITNESCIRDQILMLPGDVYNNDRLIASYQSVANLGFFETPLPAPETRPANEQGDVDIIFKVKEKHTGNVNFGASVGQGYGVGGFIGFDQPNLFGMCKRGSLQWQFGQYINDFSLSYTDPRIKGSQVTGSVTAYNRQSRFVVGDLGRTTQTGGDLRFGFPVMGSRWTRLFIDYGGEKVRYGNSGLVGTVGCSGGSSTNANCFRSSVGVTLDRDTRFDMPFPSSGVHQSISSSFNGGPLGGSAAFQRYVAEMRSYSTLAAFGGEQPGSAPIKVVFGLTARAGALFGNPGPFFVSQSFSLGGVQYGEPLRGYEEFSITPKGYLATTDNYNASRVSFGNSFYTSTAELGLRFNQQLYVDAFYDAGNIWERPRDFNPTRLFRGAGFGASLVTPLGPLGIDLGYGFDRVDALGRSNPKWQVHFKFGQIF